MANFPHDVCQQLVPSLADTILNTVLLILMFLAQVPQYIRIISRRCTSGISPSTIILSLIFNCCLASTQLYYSSLSNGPIECCRPNGLYGPNGPESDGSDQHLSGVEALGVLLALCQIGVLMLGSLILFTLFLVFPPRFSLTGSDFNRSSTAMLAAITPIILIFTFLHFGSALHFALEPKHRDIGKCCRDLTEKLMWVASMIPTFLFGIVQYIPQIRFTKGQRNCGSLSFIGLAIQAPLLMALGLNLGLRSWRAESMWDSPPLGSDKAYSFTYGSFGPLMTAVAQVVLLCVLWRVGRERMVPSISGHNEASEQTPLLREA